MSQGGDSIRKLMESIRVKEDWGSSDWYSVIQSMDKHIDKYGLSPEKIRDAARNAAEFWGDMMGHDMSTRDGEQDAIDDCIAGWMRMSERGQALQKMFAPKEPEPEKDYDPADHGIERLGIPQESVNEGFDSPGSVAIELKHMYDNNENNVQQRAAESPEFYRAIMYTLYPNAEEIDGTEQYHAIVDKLEELFTTEESINEGEVTADYELEIESYPDGEVHVMIKVLGTDQVVCEMDLDTWKGLMREFNKYASRKV